MIKGLVMQKEGIKVPFASLDILGNTFADLYAALLGLDLSVEFIYPLNSHLMTDRYVYF